MVLYATKMGSAESEEVWRKELERGDIEFKIWMVRMLYVI